MGQRGEKEKRAERGVGEAKLGAIFHARGKKFRRCVFFGWAIGDRRNKRAQLQERCTDPDEHKDRDFVTIHYPLGEE